MREGESSVIDALTYLPRGQRVLIIKRTCHADWTPIVKRIKKKKIPSGAVRRQQYKTSKCLLIVWNRYFGKIINTKRKQSTPFCGHQDPVRNEDKQLRRESPLDAGAPAELSKVEKVSVILPIIFSLFFTLAEWNLPFGGRRMTEFRGHSLIDREWVYRVWRSPCTNLDVYCMLPFWNCPYSINNDSWEPLGRCHWVRNRT